MSTASHSKVKSLSASKHGIFYGWWIVLASAIISFYVGGFFFYSFTAFFNPIKEHFLWSSAAISLAMSLRSFESGMASPISGFLADKFGPRSVIFFGALMTGAGAILLSRTNSLATFYLAYIVVSLGMSGCIGVAPLTAVANWFSNKVGRATGLMAAGFALSGFLTPVVVWLIAQYDWRTTLVIIGIGTWVICLPLALMVRHKPEQYGYLPDGEMVATPLSSRVMGMATLEFAEVEVKEETPIETVLTVGEAVRTRTFWLMAIVLAVNSLTVVAVMVHLMPYLNDIDISIRTAGFIVPFVTVFSIVGRLGSGWLADIFDKRYAMIVACILRTLGLVVFTYAHSLPGLILFALTFGPGYGAITVLRMAILREHFGRSAIGTIHGLIMGLMTVGSVLGPWFAGLIFDARGDYFLAWLVIAIVSAISIPLPLMIRPHRRAARGTSSLQTT